MFTINKRSSCEAVDYAAQELKKYLRMMMPEGGDVKIAYAPRRRGLQGADRRDEVPASRRIFQHTARRLSQNIRNFSTSAHGLKRFRPA